MHNSLLFLTVWLLLPLLVSGAEPAAKPAESANVVAGWTASSAVTVSVAPAELAMPGPVLQFCLPGQGSGSLTSPVQPLISPGWYRLEFQVQTTGFNPEGADYWRDGSAGADLRLLPDAGQPLPLLRLRYSDTRNWSPVRCCFRLPPGSKSGRLQFNLSSGTLKWHPAVTFSAPALTPLGFDWDRTVPNAPPCASYKRLTGHPGITVVDDAGALLGKAFRAAPGASPARTLFHENTVAEFAPGDYLAIFRLKLPGPAPAPDKPVVDLQVTDSRVVQGGATASLAPVGADFTPGVYREFVLPYTVPTAPGTISFTVVYTGVAELWFDSVRCYKLDDKKKE